MRKGKAAGTARRGNVNGDANARRRSPLPVISSSPRHFKMTTTYNSRQYDSASAHISESYNVVTLLKTPKAEPSASPAIRNTTPRISSIEDVRDLVSSRLESFKRESDHTYSAVLKELEASSSRLSKRLKMQTQSATQHAEEADREWKKHSDRLNEGIEEIESIFTELISEAQSSGSRLIKTSIPEIMRSAEKSLESLRSRYAL